jgi:hypothetical protein
MNERKPMNKVHPLTQVFALAAALFLVLAACGTTDTGDSGELPRNDNPLDTPGAAGACLEGEPDCNDTGDMNTPGPLPLDDSLGNGDAVTGSGAPADGGVSVSEALASGGEGLITVQGFLVADDAGAKLCEALAESYPPQCGGASVPVVDYEEMVDVPTQNAQGVTWTDQFLSLTGEVVDGVFVVDPTFTG